MSHVSNADIGVDILDLLPDASWPEGEELDRVGADEVGVEGLGVLGLGQQAHDHPHDHAEDARDGRVPHVRYLVHGEVQEAVLSRAGMKVKAVGVNFSARLGLSPTRRWQWRW